MPAIATEKLDVKYFPSLVNFPAPDMGQGVIGLDPNARLVFLPRSEFQMKWKEGEPLPSGTLKTTINRTADDGSGVLIGTLQSLDRAALKPALDKLAADLHTLLGREPTKDDWKKVAKLLI